MLPKACWPTLLQGSYTVSSYLEGACTNRSLISCTRLLQLSLKALLCFARINLATLHAPCDTHAARCELIAHLCQECEACQATKGTACDTSS